MKIKDFWIGKDKNEIRNRWFAHLSVEVPGKNTKNEWLEPVDAVAYGALD